MRASSVVKLFETTMTSVVAGSKSGECPNGRATVDIREKPHFRCMRGT